MPEISARRLPLYFASTLVSLVKETTTNGAVNKEINKQRKVCEQGSTTIQEEVIIVRREEVVDAATRS